MKDDEAQGEAQAPGTPEPDGSVDSVLRAVARVPPVAEALEPWGVRRIATTETLDAPQVARGADAQQTSSELEPARAPRVGDIVGGRYELTELLGSGGMGAVFAARHRGTGREVAVKVLLPAELGRRWKYERRERFVREAKAAGRVRHPNVVDVYDVDGDADPPHIIMERLHGESLWQRMSRGPMPVDDVLSLILAAARGVAEAHRQGVIHRDLKPDNIFLTKVPGSTEPVPKVLDFGVSRILTRDESEDRPTTLTRTGHVVGTPSYMPLEQLRGESDVGARADVYSLGVILYEALCGHRPYGARNDHDLVIRMMTEAPIPLSERAQQVEPSLSAIVMKALAREPERRFESIVAFTEALERWRAGERELPPVSEPTQETDERSVEGATPSKSRAKTIAVAVLLTVVGAGAAWVLLDRSTDPAPPADVTPGPTPPTSTGRPGVALPTGAPSPASTTAPPAPAPAGAEGNAQPPTATPSEQGTPIPTKPKRRSAAAKDNSARDSSPTKLKPEEF